MTRFEYGCHAIYNIGYHLVWTPKYRKSILKGNFKYIIQKALYKKALNLKVSIKELEIMPDHVHLFIKCKPTHKICNIVKHLKGYSSYMLRKIYPKYKVLYKHFWSSSYYCETVGCISEKTIRKYINNQWKK